MNFVTLTTVDDLKEVTSISKNIQDGLIDPYISIAEEYFVYPVIGDALLSELRNQITGNTITPSNNTLLIQYIRPLVAYGAWHQYIPFASIKSTQKGEVFQTSDNSSTAGLDGIVFKRQALKDQITFFENRLKNYLEENKQSYPLYRSKCKSNNTYGGIYLGRY